MRIKNYRTFENKQLKKKKKYPKNDLRINSMYQKSNDKIYVCI